MATTYTIRVNNKSGEEQDYFLFSKSPKVSGDTAVYSNALAHTLVQTQGTGSFAFQRTYYAICGSTKGSLDTGMLISGFQGAQVTLSTKKNGSDVPMQGKGSPNPGAKFDLEHITADCQTDGSFMIKTDKGFTVKGTSNPKKRE
jgi:hypothetical protein